MKHHKKLEFGDVANEAIVRTSINTNVLEYVSFARTITLGGPTGPSKLIDYATLDGGYLIELDPTTRDVSVTFGSTGQRAIVPITNVLCYRRLPSVGLAA